MNKEFYEKEFKESLIKLRDLKDEVFLSEVKFQTCERKIEPFILITINEPSEKSIKSAEEWLVKNKSFPGNTKLNLLDKKNMFNLFEVVF